MKHYCYGLPVDEPYAKLNLELSWLGLKGGSHVHVSLPEPMVQIAQEEYANLFGQESLERRLKDEECGTFGVVEVITYLVNHVNRLKEEKEQVINNLSTVNEN